MNVNKVPPIEEPLFRYPGVGEGLGIADRYFNGCDFVEATCSYKTKSGKLLHPGVYRVPANHREFFKTMNKRGTLIRLVPMTAFQCESQSE